MRNRKKWYYREFPVCSFEEVFHVGYFKPELKKFGSYEGAGVSVSTHPEEWERITPLPGYIHSCKRENNIFLDIHELVKDQRKLIEKWGIEEGYLEAVTVCQVTYFDDEMDEDLSFHYEDVAKARADYGEELEDMDVELIETIQTTEKMETKVMHEKTTGSIAFDLLATLFVEEFLDIDGVWWEDILDVYRYSAPRGVILPTKLEGWDIVRLENDSREVI